MNVRTILIASLMALACAGCNTVSPPDATASIESGDDAYFVIGIAPPNAKVHILYGDVENGQMRFSAIAAPTILDRPTDGFILGKAHSGDTLGLKDVQLMSGESDLSGGPSFTTCDSTLVFTVAGGKVTYITNVQFTEQKEAAYPYLAVRLDYHQDIAAAREFLKKHYPRLGDNLEQGSHRTMPSTGCYMY